MSAPDEEALSDLEAAASCSGRKAADGALLQGLRDYLCRVAVENARLLGCPVEEAMERLVRGQIVLSQEDKAALWADLGGKPEDPEDRAAAIRVATAAYRAEVARVLA